MPGRARALGSADLSFSKTSSLSAGHQKTLLPAYPPVLKQRQIGLLGTSWGTDNWDCSPSLSLPQGGEVLGTRQKHYVMSKSP